VRSFAHLPLGLSDRNSVNVLCPNALWVGTELFDSGVLESGFNPVLQILNPNPIRIRYQPDTTGNPDPATGKKISFLILLEAAGVRIKKTQNPVHAHLCCSITDMLSSLRSRDSCPGCEAAVGPQPADIFGGGVKLL